MRRNHLRLIAVVLISLILVLSVSSCSSVKKVIGIKEEIPRTALNLSADFPIELENIQWIIINEENYQEVFDRLKKMNSKVVLYGVTGSDYEKLSVNNSRILEMIKQKNFVILEYKEYYETRKTEENK